MLQFTSPNKTIFKLKSEHVINGLLFEGWGQFTTEISVWNPLCRSRFLRTIRECLERECCGMCVLCCIILLLAVWLMKFKFCQLQKHVRFAHYCKNSNHITLKQLITQSIQRHLSNLTRLARKSSEERGRHGVLQLDIFLLFGHPMKSQEDRQHSESRENVTSKCEIRNLTDAIECT